MSSGQQPAGARLDDSGNRLWQWSGTGTLEEFYSVTTMLGGGVPKHLEAWYSKLVAELVMADMAKPHSRAQAIVRRWERAGRAWVAERQAAGELKSIKADKLTAAEFALRWLKGAPDRTRDRAAVLGSDVHAASEEFVLQHAREGARLWIETGEIPEWTDDIAPHMASFVSFLADYRPVYLATEARMFSRSRSYAGQCDAFLRVKVPDGWQAPPWIRLPLVEPGWLTLCVDYKSGKAIYHEVALQTAAYANADFVGAPDNVTELPVPQVDGTAVLHITPKGYAFRLLRFDDQVFRTFLFAREIFAWVSRESLVGTRTWLGEPVPSDVLAEVA